MLGPERSLAADAPDITSLGAPDDGRLWVGTVIGLPEQFNGSGLVSALTLAEGQPGNRWANTQRAVDDFSPC